MPQRAAPVASLQNETVKLIRSLESRKARRETGLFTAAGAGVLALARGAGHVPEILVTGPDAAGGAEAEIAGWAEASGARILPVTLAVLRKLAGRDNPQPLLGVCRQPRGSAPDPSRVAASETWIALEEVRDPGNLGTIIRTADAAGARGVLLIGPSCDPHAPDCVQATMGSIFAVPVVGMEMDAFAALARAWPGDVTGTAIDAAEDFRTARPTEPVLLVMGREGPGLSGALASLCTRHVAIPMAGRAQSLNLSVATALALYQIRARHLRL